MPSAWDLEANHVDIHSSVYTKAITGVNVVNVNYHKGSVVAYVHHFHYPEPNTYK